MKNQEIREQTTEDLTARVRELKQQLMHLRIQKSTGQLENKGAIQNLKKEVARILTIVHERKLGIRQAGATGSAPQAPKAPAPAAKKPAAKKAARKTAKKAE